MDEVLKDLLAAVRDLGTGARLTVDVFDTVLTRRYLAPTDVFHETAERALAAGVLDQRSAGSFAADRVEAERGAERAHGTSCATLAEIYAHYAEGAGLKSTDADRLRALEIEVEVAAAVPIPSVIEVLEACRRHGARIAFISDMYLGTETIRRLLDQIGVAHPEAEIVVSCEQRRRKADGGLFACCGLSREPGFLHLGDSRERDGDGARRAGGVPYIVSPASPTRYEQQLANAGAQGPAAHRRLAGTARATRLATPPAMDRRARVIGETAANLAGPLALAYAAWTLERAQQRGLRRLFFAAREGEILLSVARELEREWRTGIDLRYLCVSRNTLMLPSCTACDDAVVAWLVPARGNANARVLAARSGLAPAVLSELLAPRVGDEWDAGNWPREVRERVAAELCGQAFATRFDAVVRERRERLLAYLKQEGLADGEPAGLVDTGWTGRSLDYLIRAGRLGGVPVQVEGFYFSLGEAGWMEPAHREAFLHDVRVPEGRGSIAGRCVTLVELLFAATHGSTLDYAAGADGRFSPVFSKAASQLLDGWGVSSQQERILAFAREAAAVVPRSALIQFPWRPALAGMLEDFQSAPSIEEADAFGSAPFSEEHGTDSARPFAEPIGSRDLIRYAATGSLLGSRPGVGTWLEASLTLTSPAGRRMIRLIAYARDRLLP